MSESIWYYSLNGQQSAPVSFSELQHLAMIGQLRPVDLVWSEGMPEWAQASTVQGLFASPPPSAGVYVPSYGVAASQYQTQMLGNVVYAGFWWRVLAYVIDTIILLIHGYLFIVVLEVLGIRGRDAEGIGKLFDAIVGWLYYALQEASVHQGTLGKRACGLIVTDMNGQRISFGRATGRYFAKFLSSLILFIGFIMAGFTEKRQALHDMIASTLVLKRQP